MNKRLALSVLLLATLLPIPAHAGKRGNMRLASSSSSATAGTSGPPSARIEPLL